MSSKRDNLPLKKKKRAYLQALGTSYHIAKQLATETHHLQDPDLKDVYSLDQSTSELANKMHACAESILAKCKLETLL